MGGNLPNTEKWLSTVMRELPLPVNFLNMAFETLTHGADAGGL